jgi:hypothetical protein
MTAIGKPVLAFMTATVFFVMPAAALDAGSKDPAKTKAPAISKHVGSGGGAGKVKGTKPKPALNPQPLPPRHQTSAVDQQVNLRG